MSAPIFKKPYWGHWQNPHSPENRFLIKQDDSHRVLWLIDYYCSQKNTTLYSINEDAYHYIDSLQVSKIEGHFLAMPRSMKIATPFGGIDVAMISESDEKVAVEAIGIKSGLPSDTKALCVSIDGERGSSLEVHIREDHLSDYLIEKQRVPANSIFDESKRATENEMDKVAAAALFVVKLAILLQTEGFGENIEVKRQQIGKLKGREIHRFKKGRFVQAASTSFFVAPFVRQLIDERYYKGKFENLPRGSRFAFVKAHTRTRVTITNTNKKR